MNTKHSVKKISTIISAISDMWELQYGGYAKGYYVYGSAVYTVNWNYGDRLGTGAVIQ